MYLFNSTVFLTTLVFLVNQKKRMKMQVTQKKMYSFLSKAELKTTYRS